MKIGSRPMARIARTGELTPPGITCRARLYSAAERVSVNAVIGPAGEALESATSSSVRALPLLEVLGEVEEADLLELRRGVQRRALMDPGLIGDRVEHRVALFLRAPVGDRKSTRLN